MTFVTDILLDTIMRDCEIRLAHNSIEVWYLYLDDNTYSEHMYIDAKHYRTRIIDKNELITCLVDWYDYTHNY